MEFKIKDHTQYLVLSGSYAYGLQHSESDYDLRGWAIPPKEYFLSFNKNFEQNDQNFTFKNYPFREELISYINGNWFREPDSEEGIDHAIYDIRKFFKLAADCNPNVLETLFVDGKDIIYATELGMKLRQNRHKFISCRARYSYVGYAVSQIKRIETHRRWLQNPPSHKPTRNEFGLPETTAIPADQREAAEKLVTDKVRTWLFQNIDTIDKTTLAMFHERLIEFVSNILQHEEFIINHVKDLERFASIPAMKIYNFDENYIDVLQREKAYKHAKQEWDQYQSWKKNRNPARAKLEAESGYDRKHAMHTYRLLLQGLEIITKNDLTVNCSSYKELLEIKEGKWSYEKLIERAKELRDEIDKTYNEKKCVVPHKPDVNFLSNLCQEIVEEFND